ncbi:MAG: hypothetical protein HWE27_06735 [Gammaproteobacteria bacterium]|nr:hypothetical protein [Gammaproteobacteria bacterium]
MTKSAYKILIMLTVIAVLLGCGEKKPMVTQQDISAARQNGNLEQLYAKVNADLAESSGSRQASLKAISMQIALQLAKDNQAKIYQTIEDNRLPGGVTSLALLNDLEQQANNIQQWDTATSTETLQKIRSEKSLAQTELQKTLVRVSKIPVSNELERLNAMNMAAKIAGEGSPQYNNFVNQKDQTIATWMSQADAAIANREYTLAATFLRKVLGLEPENQEAKDKLANSEQEGFESAFRKALEDEKPELALSELQRISISPLFSGIKSSLESSISALHEYFINRALQNSSQGALKTAYKNYKKARTIREIMEMPAKHNAEKDYIERLINFSNVKGQKKEYAQQLAYLEMANEFDSEYQNLAKTLQDARTNIVEYAATSMLVKDFAQTGTHHSAGKSVAKQVYNWVFNNLKGDVALVSASQMSNADTSAPGRLLTLEGDILQAGVDSESTNSQKTMRVTVETIKTPNPEFQEWKEDGSEGEAPQEFFVEEKQENISVEVSHVRKTGILSISFRVIDQKTGQVLLNETARDKQVSEGEGNEGVSIGEFELPFRRPELPSDLELMEQLSNQVAIQIGEKLQAILTSPDRRYEEMADAALKQKQYAAAKAYYGYATAIRGMKGDYQDVKTKLIDTVINY